MSPRAKPLLAPDRVRLYLSLVPYLAERGQVAVADAAADFGVSPDDMRGMVQKLTVIGLPGEDGFWQLDQDLFNINWDLLEADDVIELTNTVALHRAPRLTAREAAALLSGLRLLQGVSGVDDAGVVSGLVTKLAHGSSAAPADVVVVPPATDAVRTVVATALRERRAMSFTYRAPDAEPTVRTVDPVQVHVTSGEWYLQGWCHLRRAMRTFHLARVSDAVVTDIAAEHGAGDAAALFTRDDDDAGEAEVRYPADLAPLLGGFLTRGATQTVGGVTRATVRVSDPRSLKRSASRIGGSVEVIAPETAREATRDWARAALEQYDT